jgi:CBS domain-containing protein
MSPGKLTIELKVSDLGEIVSRMPPAVQKSASIRQAIAVMFSSSHSDRIYVIDIEGNLVGLVTSRGIMRMLGRRIEIKQIATKPLHEVIQEVLDEGVEQAIQRPIPIKASTPLATAISLMNENDLAEAPVVDDDYKLIGELSSLEMLTTSNLLRKKES